MALLRDHIEASMSTRSPTVYAARGPLAIAEATADLRKSIILTFIAKFLHVGIVNDIRQRK